MNTTQRSKLDYSIAQKVIHWLMALLIMMDLFVAQKFGNVMAEWDRLESRVDHGSLGTMIAILFLVRIFLRLRQGTPLMPSARPMWQVRLAGLTHGALYFFMACLILSGLATAANATSPLALFGIFDITIGQTDDSSFRYIRQFHELTSQILIALIGLHIAAALYHMVIVRDGITERQLRFWRSETGTKGSE